MAQAPDETPLSQDNVSTDDKATWSSAGFIENGFRPLLDVGVGTLVGKLKKECGVCFELYEIISTPNAKQLSKIFNVLIRV